MNNPGKSAKIAVSLVGDNFDWAIQIGPRTDRVAIVV
jgi:hypothetical protein